MLVLLCFCAEEELHFFPLIVLQQEKAENVLVCSMQFHFTFLSAHIRGGSIIKYNKPSIPVGNEERGMGKGIGKRSSIIAFREKQKAAVLLWIILLHGEGGRLTGLWLFFLLDGEKVFRLLLAPARS